MSTIIGSQIGAVSAIKIRSTHRLTRSWLD